MNNWLDWYCKKLEEHKHSAMYRDRYLCPCCYMPTLSERGGFETCPICFWEDDGQDSDDASEVRGGPNHDYSLAEARANFVAHLTMYRPNDKQAFTREIARNNTKLALYEAFKKAIENNYESDWLAALDSEKALSRRS